MRAGDRLLIRGASGSGKSTLLQVLAGLAPEYVAGVLSGGREIHYRTKGVVLQNPEAQIVTPTVEEEVAFALENAGVEPREIRPRVSETLETLGIPELAQRHPLTLSGGECQRVSLAAALALRPDILFLDEPTAYLDEESSRSFFRYLSILPEKTAVVVVEHRIEAAAPICRTSVEVTQEGTLIPSDFSPMDALPDYHARRSVDGSGPPALEVEGLDHRFAKGSPPLFRDLRFSVRPGEIAALMGPSGCGKTTVLCKIARILDSDSGRIFFAGRDAAKLRKQDFNASFMYIPQNPEHMFIGDTVSEELEASGGGAAFIARRFGLEDRLAANPFRLSEGEKRRLNIASALAAERPLYLLDEPTYGLDGRTRALLARDILALAEKGAAVLFVTHDTAFARSVADRILVMRGGRIEEERGRYEEACQRA